VATADRAKADLRDQVTEATEGAVTSATKRDQLLAYILEEHGVTLPDMRSDTLKRRLEDPALPEAVKLLIAIRMEAGMSSSSKYTALLNARVGRRAPAQHDAVRRRAAHGALGGPHLPAAKHEAARPGYAAGGGGGADRGDAGRRARSRARRADALPLEHRARLHRGAERRS
jgi:hypothetical protein